MPRNKPVHYLIHHENTESSPDNDADDFLLCGEPNANDKAASTTLSDFVTCKNCRRQMGDE